jgi:hypothetical protein
MTDQHPITPPPELIGHWIQEWINTHGPDKEGIDYVVVQAAQYGADQELEACLRLVEIDAGEDAYDFARYIRAARRPKPPSLKERALEALDRMDQLPTTEDRQIIRRALETLPDD